MKKKYNILAITAIGLLMACNSRSDTVKAVDNHLDTTPDGLKIDTVFVSTEEVQPAENTFVYGQTFYTNFKGIDGFTIEDDDYFPEMEVYVLSKAKDTVLQVRNLLGGLGQPQDIPILNGSLILANPILSGTDYKVKYKLYDTKGNGAFYSEMDFRLIRDPHIQVEEKGLKAKEIYLFNQDKGLVMTNGAAAVETNMSMDFQLLEGYEKKDGKIALGMEIQVTDATGTKITQVKDALVNTSYDFIRDADVVQSSLRLTKGGLKNPITWQVRLWDKNSTAEMTATATLDIEN